MSITNSNTFKNSLDNLPPPIPMLRTYKAICQYCGSRSTSIDDNNRISPCCSCRYGRIPMIQSIVRGYLTRKLFKRYQTRDIMNRWFISNGYNGGDLSLHISSFV